MKKITLLMVLSACIVTMGYAEEVKKDEKVVQKIEQKTEVLPVVAVATSVVKEVPSVVTSTQTAVTEKVEAPVVVPVPVSVVEKPKNMTDDGFVKVEKIDKDKRLECFYPSFFVMAQEGDVEGLQLFLNRGVTINFADINDMTALIHAVRMKHADAAGMLLKAGADVNKADIYKNTALLYAVKANDIGLVNLLIGGGADLNLSNTQGKNSLILATQYQYKAIFKVVLKKGKNTINIDAQDKGGMTALMFAVKNDDVKGVKSLLKAKADVFIENANKETAISLAEKTLQIKIRKLIFKAKNKKKK